MAVVEQLFELCLKQIELKGFQPQFGLRADLKWPVVDPSRDDCWQF